MSDAENPQEWQPWIERACRAVGVDPSLVRTDTVLALTRTVAHSLPRPMAPVAAHILGLAMASPGAPAPGDLVERLVGTLPTVTE
jgi:hypothetical protein